MDFPVSLPLFLLRSGSNARGESRALEGRRVSSKSPSRVRDGDEGVARRNVRERIFHFSGHNDQGADPMPLFDFRGTRDPQKPKKKRFFDFWGTCNHLAGAKIKKSEEKRQGCNSTSTSPPKIKKCGRWQFHLPQSGNSTHSLQKSKKSGRTTIMLPLEIMLPIDFTAVLCWASPASIIIIISPTVCYHSTAHCTTISMIIIIIPILWGMLH